ncbi:MAG: hypothetical protein MUF54_19715 [Polyangiaceae bacterium]|nr:hypothetical protein [Polyangiaceae bacterium]
MRRAVLLWGPVAGTTLVIACGSSEETAAPAPDAGPGGNDASVDGSEGTAGGCAAVGANCATPSDCCSHACDATHTRWVARVLYFPEATKSPIAKQIADHLRSIANAPGMRPNVFMKVGDSII